MKSNASWNLTILCMGALGGLAWSCHRTDGGPPDASANPTPAVHAHSEARGAIFGHLRWRGKRPPPAQLQTSLSVERTCGRSVPDRSFRVDPDGNLANVVVFLDDPQLEVGGEPPSSAVTVDQRECAYLPPVVVARAGAPIEFLNSDPLIHNVHAVRGSMPLFNFAMPLQGIRVQKKVPSSPGVLELRCDLHPWMHAVVRVFAHPYFALSDSHGRYELSPVPSGTHKLTFWHERLRSRSLSVSVSAGERSAQNAEWSMEDLTSGRLSSDAAE